MIPKRVVGPLGREKEEEEEEEEEEEAAFRGSHPRLTRTRRLCIVWREGGWVGGWVGAREGQINHPPS